MKIKPTPTPAGNMRDDYGAGYGDAMDRREMISRLKSKPESWTGTIVGGLIAIPILWAILTLLLVF